MSKRPIRRRLDDLLVDEGLAPDAGTAARLIMAGRVQIADLDAGPVLSAGMTFPEGTDLSLKPAPKYVSRGGLKLEHALVEFGIDVTGMVALDVGASTGGFTDCLLQHGAKHVFAVDAGRGQLHERLVRDPRVTSMERTNARIGFELPEPVDIITADVSFISLYAVLPRSFAHLKPGGVCVALLKPQFEARRDEVGHGGVIHDDEVRGRVVDRFFAAAAGHCVELLAWKESPVRGSAGNREFLIKVQPAADS